MTIYRGVNGVNREIKQQFRGVGGVNREIKEQYRGVGGANRKVFTNWDGRIYDNGIEFTQNTGGFIVTHISTGAVEKQSTQILITEYYNKNYNCVCVVSTAIPVDITKFTKLKAEIGGSSFRDSGSRMGLTKTLPSTATYPPEETYIGFDRSGWLPDLYNNGLDISSVSGDYYVYILIVMSSKNGGHTGTIKKIWLE